MDDTPATAAAAPEGIVLCASTDLVEGGPAHVFDLLEHGQPVRGFVLRFEGRPRAYLNRCAHVPAELDWQPGRFMDDTGRWILCAIHGAAYDPVDGHCVAGPCRGRRLKPLHVAEQAGRVCWYPEDELQNVTPTSPP
ncbi:nitrite reductase/ring-hydroxylating ferredoxin subunit [Sphaerotilus hippei]|uniref:Nitrite reductase/ring-hydroxylating ferredoxin subunit n=1 Tax=Sphaerotilus hippei TaxID=744406 RepID=A0A318H1G1_9BURK|nr:Rieske 2Fe-2S domain-containing protein [Sphaerotilus hippei]PXW97023.1 nitrite reductase/ring-hydroxylating ferredoxin subunit [Sphaerotilus hippei]